MRFRKAPVQGGALYLQSKGDMLLLLSQKENYFFRVLRRCDLRVGRCQILQKRGEWYLQLTLQMPTPLPKEPERVLGISFDLDAVATWSVLSLDGSVLETGALSPNEQIQSFLERKAALEWDQQKGRWVGGRRFSGELERIAHNVANQLLALAEEHDAALAVEEISYVQKASPNHEQNRLFSAWNFGQLSKILDYKSRMAGRTKAYASDYVTKLTCPACEAIGSAKDPPNKRATWRDETGALECRRCGRNQVVTPHDRARRAALHAIKLLRERKKRARKRAG
jgi:IS605 OrfB family transposase